MQIIQFPFFSRRGAFNPSEDFKMAESVVLFFVGSRCKCVSVGKNGINASDLKSGIATDGCQGLRDFYLTCDGRKLGDNCVIRPGKCVWLVPRVIGGKGGFGSMLRAIGAQIEKTTNREACRDLSGRRLRDINEEKRLKKWIAKQADAERGREQRRQERLARMLVVPKHEFNDPNYYKQRSQITDTVEDALSQGLSAGPSGESDKRKANSDNKPAKRVKLWVGVDDELCESSDTDTENCIEEPNVASSSDGDSSSNEKCTAASHQITENDKISNECANTNPVTQSECDSSEFIKEVQDKLPDAQTQLEVPSSSSSSDIVHQLPVDHNENNANAHLRIDFENFNCAAELEKLGLEQLKVALMQRGLKCGGTLQERAKRLFSVKGLDPKDIDPSLLAKPIKKHK